MTRRLSLAKRVALVGATASCLAACTTPTHLGTSAPHSTLVFKGLPHTELPRDEVLDSKSTGQYEFKATSAQGATMYGILPMRVNGKTMTLSILFFAPALALGGFRDPYALYEFDPDKNQVRYKNKAGDNWVTFEPTEEQSHRAMASFQDLAAVQPLPPSKPSATPAAPAAK
ncbi:MAG TPA: hypothetical protein VGM81_13995 [Burkholderiaceae bacterium]|jgi:hypothetical protein